MKKYFYSLFIALFMLVATHSNAQVAALPFTASLDTFNVITGTTVDAPNADDISYPNIPIGFNFYYHGNSYSKMSLTTNGYVSLDSITYSPFYNIMAGNINNVIAPLGADLIHHLANASLQYITIGTAPNRICIVQWLHYSYFGNNGDLSFQLQMYETSNCIRFVYGNNIILSTPLNTQIGLRGASNLDFNVLGDTACNWANAYPYPAITTMFPISLSCSMPSGFAFHFGQCLGGGLSNFGYITGKVFNDVNGNGVLNTGEPAIANHIVHIMPGNYYVSSDAAGSYNFFFVDSTLTYSLNTGGITYWNQTTLPTVMTCHPATQSCNGYNFGFHMMPNVNEVSIYCPNWGARPGTPEPMPISYHNNGTSTLSDTIQFVMDPLYSFISSTPAPVAIIGNTIKWAYSNLQPNQSGSIMLYLMPDTNAIMGNYLNSTLTIKPLNDTIPANNVVALHQLLSNSWDPNEKLAEPSGMITLGSTINYTIHFQNTGTAVAYNVTVTDQLDPDLDMLTFNLIGSSHPMNFSMSGNGKATFTFYNIHLPDSNANFEGSNGYVSFSIKTKNSLPPLTVISNVAGIVFDLNPPIWTNVTYDTIKNGVITSVNSTSEKTRWNLFPNPAADHVVFVLTGNAQDNATLKVLNMEGQKVLEKTSLLSNEIIDISQLADGVYVCYIQSAEKTEILRLVKQK